MHRRPLSLPVQTLAGQASAVVLRQSLSIGGGGRGYKLLIPRPRPQIRRLRSGRLLAFLSPIAAMKENKTQSKEGEEEGVFLGFGDDLAVDDNSYGSAG